MYLKVLKESHPVDIYEYITAPGISVEPFFTWWVPFTLKKRDQIIVSVNIQVRKYTHKFDIWVPKNVNEALQINKVNVNTLCYDVYAKEMYQVGVSFQILKDGESIPVGYKYR